MTKSTLSLADVQERLTRVGVDWPTSAPHPAGNYVPFRLHNGIGFLAAQTSGLDGLFSGQVGRDLSVEIGQKAAARAAVFALYRIHEALAGFERLVGLLHVAGHVCSAEGFREQPRVLDGASNLFRAALGDRGLHSRTAYGPTQIVGDLVIELEITFAYAETMTRGRRGRGEAASRG